MNAHPISSRTRSNTGGNLILDKNVTRSNPGVNLILDRYIPHVFENIASNLDISDVARLRCVSKDWKRSLDSSTSIKKDLQEENIIQNWIRGKASSGPICAIKNVDPFEELHEDPFSPDYISLHEEWGQISLYGRKKKEIKEQEAYVKCIQKIPIDYLFVTPKRIYFLTEEEEAQIHVTAINKDTGKEIPLPEIEQDLNWSTFYPHTEWHQQCFLFLKNDICRIADDGVVVRGSLDVDLAPVGECWGIENALDDYILLRGRTKVKLYNFIENRTIW